MRKTAKDRYFGRERAVIGSSTVDFSGPVLTGGKGAVARDLSRKEFLDFTGQISLLNTGYSPQEVVSAICQMAKHLHSCISADYPYLREITINGEKKEVSRAALAEKLIAITSQVMPFPKRVYFEVSGATSVNLALKLAKISFLRKRGVRTGDFNRFFEDDIFIPSEDELFKFSILDARGAFHGRHGDVQCLTNSKVRQLWAASSSCAFGRLPFPSPGTNREYFWNKTREIMHKLHEFAPIVAFVFEPVQGEGGINVPDKELLNELIDYLRKRKICIIADEIQSGLGRTGKMWACEHFGVQPDMLCTSKSLGAGIPISAVIVNDDKFSDLEPGMHSGSHHATPLAVAAAIANIDLIIDGVSTGKPLLYGRHILDILSSRREFYGFCDKIIEVRGLGLMIGIEFASADCRDKVLDVCKKYGLLLAPAGSKTIRMTPPLVVTLSQINQALDIFWNACEAAQ